MEKVDVAIVGAGLSGALMASEARRAGLSCVVLEAGPAPRGAFPEGAAAFARRSGALLAVDEAAWGHRVRRKPLPWFRVRAAGGRSLVWGGWCDAPDAANLRDARALGAPWPISATELDALVARALAFLAPKDAPVSDAARRVSAALGVPVTAKRAAISPGGGRALVATDRLPRALLRPHAIARRLVFHAGTARIRGVEWQDARSGLGRFVEARRVVLCASPVETARLLFVSRDAAMPGLALAGLGERLGDHLIASAAVLVDAPAPSKRPPGPLDETALIPRFVNVRGGRRRDYPAGFVTEVRGPFAASTLDDLGLAAVGLEPAAARGVSYYSLHVLGEATPTVARRLRFDARAQDALGRPLPIFEVASSPDDRARAKDVDETLFAVAGVLAGPSGRVVPLRRALDRVEVGNESGACAMGRDPSRHVADPHGRVHGAEGLYVADASLMPTALDRHPTLGLLALALRAADHAFAPSRR